jgi:hypothetical protein
MLAGGAAPSEPIEVTKRPWVDEVMAEPDPTRMVALLVDHGSDIFVRIAPLTAAMMAAAADDADVGQLVRGILEGRRAGQRRAVEALAEKGGLREDMPVEMAADILYGLQSAPLFQVMTAGLWLDTRRLLHRVRSAEWVDLSKRWSGRGHVRQPTLRGGRGDSPGLPIRCSAARNVPPDLPDLPGADAPSGEGEYAESDACTRRPDPVEIAA